MKYNPTAVKSVCIFFKCIFLYKLHKSKDNMINFTSVMKGRIDRTEFCAILLQSYCDVVLLQCEDSPLHLDRMEVNWRRVFAIVYCSLC